MICLIALLKLNLILLLPKAHKKQSLLHTRGCPKQGCRRSSWTCEHIAAVHPKLFSMFRHHVTCISPFPWNNLLLFSSDTTRLHCSLTLQHFGGILASANSIKYSVPDFTTSHCMDVASSPRIESKVTVGQTIQIVIPFKKGSNVCIVWPVVTGSFDPAYHWVFILFFEDARSYHHHNCVNCTLGRDWLSSLVLLTSQIHPLHL